MEEVWRPIKGYEGVYEVSSKGRVRSLDRVVECNRNGKSYLVNIKGRILKPKLTKLGYYEHGLSNGKRRDMTSVRVNRLVAEAFIPNPENKPQVHHIDHNKLNNCVENLRWVTCRENIQAEVDDGRGWGNFKTGISHHNAKFTDEQILEMFKLERKGLKRSEIADKIGCSRGYVTEILKDRKRACTKQINL